MFSLRLTLFKLSHDWLQYLIPCSKASATLYGGFIFFIFCMNECQSDWKSLKEKKERFPHTLRELTAPTLDIMCAALRDVVCYGDLIAAAMLSSAFSSFFSVKTQSDDEMRSVSVSYSIHFFSTYFFFGDNQRQTLSTYSTLYAQHQQVVSGWNRHVSFFNLSLTFLFSLFSRPTNLDFDFFIVLTLASTSKPIRLAVSSSEIIVYLLFSMSNW